MRRGGFLTRPAAVASIVAAAVCISVAQTAQTSSLPKTGIKNFGCVNKNLYRGGQPGPGDLKRLAELGIRTIVNLRGEDERTQSEGVEAKALGLRYFAIPMPGLSRPSDEQVSGVMAILDAQENWPVFIHCKRGSDRTGTIIACYRISHEGWTGSQAIAEAKRFGMSWVEFGMRDYVSDYYTRRSAAEKPVRAESNR
ncbi:MAG TPA: sulfur transferase domain-containing protein [Blastocatellia bacterium]|nr:sulfur transferase domain-containing protein [Blastocatellia bacterium]